MALRKHINPRSTLNNDTGFGEDPSKYGGRFVNKDGSYNIIRKGVKMQYRVSVFQQMIAMPLWEFSLLVLVFFVCVNIIFAFIYYFIGMGEFTTVPGSNVLHYLVHLFFFSVQALTTVTVDYNQIAPAGFWASFISSFEALCGLMTFAILTGLIYSRFARPRSYLMFSRQALISPYKGGTGLMFRLASYKDRHNLIDANVHVNLGLNVEENGKSSYKFYSLPLERFHIDTLNMNWTIVHPIDERSPLQNFSWEDLQHAQAELFIQVTGFDEVFSATVVRMTSYFYNEIIYGAKFRPMYHESDDDTTTILELDKLDDYDLVTLPGSGTRQED
jgi:inward rectifier potassium channel